MEYEFTLKYRLGANDQDVDDVVERLAAGGCDDALAGVGQPGRIALKFTREADSAKTALMSALADVRYVLPGAKLIEAGPDFVGLSDAAELVSMSRQNLRKLMLTYASTFPAPVHDGTSGVWHLADLLDWLKNKGDYPLQQEVVEVSNATKQINIARHARQISLEAHQEVARYVS
ncbi:MAG: DNA-binding protein [Paucimonas sp.]|nr:DNA-binding protein [Paucimonas sp.]